MSVERISTRTARSDTRIPIPNSNIPPTLTIDCTGKGAGFTALKIIDNAGVESTSLIENGNANFTTTTLDGTTSGVDTEMLIVKGNATGNTHFDVRETGITKINATGASFVDETTMFSIWRKTGTQSFNVKENGKVVIDATTGTADESMIALVGVGGGAPSFKVQESGITTLNGTGIAAGTTMLDIKGTGGTTQASITESGVVKPQSIQFTDASIQTIAAGYSKFQKVFGLATPIWRIPEPFIELEKYYDLDIAIFVEGDPTTNFDLWVYGMDAGPNFIGSNVFKTTDGNPGAAVAFTTMYLEDLLQCLFIKRYSCVHNEY